MEAVIFSTLSSTEYGHLQKIIIYFRLASTEDCHRWKMQTCPIYCYNNILEHVDLVNSPARIKLNSKYSNRANQTCLKVLSQLSRVHPSCRNLGLPNFHHLNFTLTTDDSLINSALGPLVSGRPPPRFLPGPPPPGRRPSPLPPPPRPRIRESTGLPKRRAGAHSAFVSLDFNPNPHGEGQSKDCIYLKSYFLSFFLLLNYI